jgi:hypothetical protein
MTLSLPLRSDSTLAHIACKYPLPAATCCAMGAPQRLRPADKPDGCPERCRSPPVRYHGTVIDQEAASRRLGYRRLHFISETLRIAANHERWEVVVAGGKEPIVLGTRGTLAGVFRDARAWLEARRPSAVRRRTVKRERAPRTQQGARNATTRLPVTRR